MQLSTFLFLCFLTIVLIVNFLFPRRYRWIWWLITSFVFCIVAGYQYAIVLAGIIIESYFIGRIVEKSGERKRKKAVLIIGLVLTLGTLFVFKYLDFSITTLNQLMLRLNLNLDAPLLNLILPLGLSFYTFQAVSYLLDIYNGTIPAEKNLGKYAVYLAFFPKLISGPIERAGLLLPQISEPRPFDYQQFIEGLLRIFWGFFKKLVIADRLAVVVADVFQDPSQFFAPQIIYAVVAFSLQIYIDFSAYCDIAIGAARILGIDLMENFNLPYLARSVTDFWRRWHISLTSWLRDYIFTPLNFATRRKRSKLYQYLNILIVFLVSGIWHGANITYILWGLIHGIYQVIEAAGQRWRVRIEKKFSKGIKKRLLYTFQTVITFALVSLAWVFFRADNLSTAFNVIDRVIRLRGVLHVKAYMLTSFTLTPADYWILAISIILFILFEIFNRKADLISRSTRLPLPLRWTIYLILIFAVILFGYFSYFNPQDFIYAAY